MQSQRLRIKAACQPCRTRKRKCDGRQPCALCVRYEYECLYRHDSRRPKSMPATSSDLSTPPLIAQSRSSSHESVSASPSDLTSTSDREKYVEANAGAVFPNVLAAKLDSPETPVIYGIGWNLGLSVYLRQHIPICNLMAMGDCHTLAASFFDRIYPVYGLPDKTTFDQAMLQRWQNALVPANDFDPIICGVAMLGSLFSGHRNPVLERRLLEWTISYLDEASNTRQSNTALATAWVLRILYLRATASPQAAWIASCTAMHLMEDAGMHQESSRRSMVYASSAKLGDNVEIQRRVFWTITMMNTWIANECGRSRVEIRNANREPPCMTPGDSTSDIIKLSNLSNSIDPDKVHEPAELENCLAQVEELVIQNDACKLSQSNLALALYRRIRMSTCSVSKKTVDAVIRLGVVGIEAVQRMMIIRCPWWHVLNQPFQFVCILLAIDTQESLRHVAQTMDVLRTVAEAFDTEAADKAFETAQLLIRLSRRRKEQEAVNLGQVEKMVDLTAVSKDFDNFVSLLPSDGTAWHDYDWPQDDQFLDQMIDEFDWDILLTQPGSILDQFMPK